MPSNFTRNGSKAGGSKAIVAALAATYLLCWSPAQAADNSVVYAVDPQLGALIARCAPSVAPSTMAAIINAESSGKMFSIADAGPVAMPWEQRKAFVRSLFPGSTHEAVAVAKNLIANGHTVSVGLSQVNDRNLARLGISIENIFDPCTNIAAGGKIITEFYIAASKKFGNTPKALHAALSAYNSGDFLRGEKEGYVNAVYKQAGKPLSLSTTALATVGMRSNGNAPARTEDAPGKVPREFGLGVVAFKDGH